MSAEQTIEEARHYAKSVLAKLPLNSSTSLGIHNEVLKQVIAELNAERLMALETADYDKDSTFDADDWTLVRGRVVEAAADGLYNEIGLWPTIAVNKVPYIKLIANAALHSREESEATIDREGPMPPEPEYNEELQFAHDELVIANKAMKNLGKHHPAIMLEVTAERQAQAERQSSAN